MKYLMLLITFCLFSLGAQSQTESGIVVSGGIGSIKTKLNPSAQGKFSPYDVNYRYNLSLGYRFRLHACEGSPFFYDLEAGLGMTQWNSSYGQVKGQPDLVEMGSKRLSSFISGTANYSIYKGLSVGAGIQPTYSFYQNGENNKNRFDIPVVAKIAYRFKAFEVGLSYKYGLMNSLNTDYLKSGKFREYALSVWIPF